MSELVNRDKKHIWHPFTQHQTSGDPLGIARAEGSLLFDESGKSYIDANSSWWVNTHGHAHPHIGAKLNEQFNTLDHVVFAGITHPKAAELAERLTNKLPDHLQKVFFSDNGSTAVEVALKMTFQYWYNKGEAKYNVLALNGAYHGDTFGAMSVGQRGYFNQPFEPFFFDVDYLDFPTSENEPEILEKAQKLLSNGSFSALIVEPLVQGASGMRMYSTEFLDELVRIAHANDVFVIFDEVMTGFGRTGKLFSLDHCSEKPDIIAMSKGLTAGILPLGLTVTSNQIFDAFLGEEVTKGFLHGHSFTGNPIACAVACASLDLFEKEETWNNIDAICLWNEAFKKELEGLEGVGKISQMGTILRFEMESTEGSYFANDLRVRAYKHFMESGVLLRPLGNVIFVNPPYCITKEEYDQVKESILSFLKSIRED